MALSPTINVMLRAAEKAGRSLIRDFGEVEQLQVSRKGPGDFVSAADKRSEEIIFEDLQRSRPDYGFLMEEGGGKGVNADAEYRWIVDPLDGTSNFLHGVPHWCISIALEHNDEIIAGVIFDPVRDEVFRAEKNEGAFMRNKRLLVSGRRNFEDAMIATGQPRREAAQQALFMAEYKTILSHTGLVRRYGAAALDLAYVAAGRFDGFWERGLHAWDIAAGALIVKEAKGIVTTIDGQSAPTHKGNVLAANMELHNDLKSLLYKAKSEKDAA